MSKSKKRVPPKKAAKTAKAGKSTDKPRQKSGAGVSQAWMGAHLDVAQQRIAQFVAEGVFPKLANGKLDPDACRVRYIRWLRDETRKSSQSESAKRVQDARAKEIELRLAQTEGRLFPADEVEAAVAQIFGTYRSELSGVPAASTRDLEQRAVIEKHLNAAIDRCRAAFEKASLDLRSGREVSLDGEEADA